MLHGQSLMINVSHCLGDAVGDIKNKQEKLKQFVVCLVISKVCSLSVYK
jgi:hypothetical protein